jgi:hypothetical protein
LRKSHIACNPPCILLATPSHHGSGEGGALRITQEKQ